MGVIGPAVCRIRQRHNLWRAHWRLHVCTQITYSYKAEVFLPNVCVCVCFMMMAYGCVPKSCCKRNDSGSFSDRSGGGQDIEQVHFFPAHVPGVLRPSQFNRTVCVCVCVCKCVCVCVCTNEDLQMYYPSLSNNLRGASLWSCAAYHNHTNTHTPTQRTHILLSNNLRGASLCSCAADYNHTNTQTPTQRTQLFC
jgi:hypothetical protein